MIRDRVLFAALDGAVGIAFAGAIAGVAYLALHPDARARAGDRMMAALEAATWQVTWSSSPPAAFARRQREALLASEGL